MTKHTGTPFNVHIGTDGNLYILDEHGNDIAKIYQGTNLTRYTSIVGAKANAKFIVLACNSHQDLIEALKKIVYIDPKNSQTTPNYCDIYEWAMKAIEKAESEV